MNHSNNLKNLTFIVFIIFGFSCNPEGEPIRSKNDFDAGWRFILQDDKHFSDTEFDDSRWRELDLPHDWSIKGKFSKDNPAGTGGGALPGGIGWYRKKFTLPEKDSMFQTYISFDGVYQNSDVYINGNHLGNRPNGYISFQYNLSPYLHYGEKENVIAVRVDNSKQPNSRWYSGSGIYRNVWLERTNRIHVDHWGTYITTPVVNEKQAEIIVSVAVRNDFNKASEIVIKTNILNENNEIVAENTAPVRVDGNSQYEIKRPLTVSSPVLWKIDSPYLYTAVNEIEVNGKLVDTYETKFGIRYFEFHPVKGFSLNGVQTKIKGVCNHHDLGALGAAVNTRATERQLQILKKMGCNAIRTSHNPPSPELLDLCDRMGFIVMDETFDMWKKNKTDYDYASYWNEWHRKDLIDHLKRDRNHPCVFIWSIGNEILEQWDTAGIRMTAELTSLVKKYAPGIPVTSACNDPNPDNYILRSGSLDLIGYNYSHLKFENFPETFPGKCFIATETTSSLNSRGMYDMPSDSIRRWPKKWDKLFVGGNPDLSCSSYDNCSTPWGSTHEETWKIIKKHDYLAGMFIWTGFDYLGEPTPYPWPARSSYFGIIDLAGFPKDAYYLYQSEWTDTDVLHIFPHWNWNKGDKIDVWAYTNCTEVSLYLNGVSQGVRYNNDSTLHLMWPVIYEPGEIRAVGKTKSGSTIETRIRTAGEPYCIDLESDRSVIESNGKDIAYITATIKDKDGNVVPNANIPVEFIVEKDGLLLATDNGKQTDTTSFQSSIRTSFNGKCLAIITAGKKGKSATIYAKSDGLRGGMVEIKFGK